MPLDEFSIKRSSRHRRGNRTDVVNLCLILTSGILILVFTCWSIRRSEIALKSNLESKLSTILEIEAEAIEEWVESQRQMISYFASDTTLSNAFAGGQTSEQLQDAVAINHALGLVAKKLGTDNCIMLSSDGRVLADSGKHWIQDQLPLLGESFCRALRSGTPAVSEAFVPCIDSAGLDDPPSHVMVFAAPISKPDKTVVGFLGVALEMNNELSRILRSSDMGATGETVATDRNGHPISNNRFGTDAKIVHGDLYPDVGSQRSPTRPKTHAHLDGALTVAGQEIVYVSRWLPKFGFGVVTKMDRAEAYAPITQIQSFIWSMGALLVLTTLSTVFYRWYLHRARVLSQKGELEQRQLGPYQLEKKLGEGAMGIVYRGKHALLRRQTAIKILPPEKSSRQAITRFEREVQFTSQLKHPNTISIYDYGRTEAGMFYYAMELLDGLNLEQLIQRERNVADGRVITILSQVCQSLHEAHQLGLVHRDVKPANIMVCNRGGAVDMVKVLDFGMVRDQAVSPNLVDATLSGTPIYMAPEAFDDPAGVDQRMDVFAIGAVGIFLLTGRSFLATSDMNELLQLHQSDLESIARARLQRHCAVHGDVIARDLIEILAQCVATDREHRIATALEVLSRLQVCCPQVPWTNVEAIHWWRQLSPAEHNGQVDEETIPSRRPERGLSMRPTRGDDGGTHAPLPDDSLAETKVFSVTDRSAPCASIN